jgi:amidohydrolase
MDRARATSTTSTETTMAHRGDLAQLYRDLHAHPELGFAEHRTAGIVASSLGELGYEVTEGIGGTGVVGTLTRGDGPVVLLRADMDALPVTEETGLAYASTATTENDGGERTGVMHACGHDVHVTCLLGAAHELADATDWHGTLLCLFQPAEELGAGARAMLDDGLYDRFPRPAVVLGQHVVPLPAGVLAVEPGPAYAASDSLRITLHGQGSHASRPQNAVDPVVLAAATVLRLQTIVAREVSPTEAAVVTVGAVHAGTVGNVIPDHAELLLSVRTFSEPVRRRVLAAIERIVHGEASAAGASRPPDIEVLNAFPAVVNDPAAVERTRPALASVAGAVVRPGPVTGSEDVGLLAREADAPCVYWLLGGADPAAFADCDLGDLTAVLERVDQQPANHSPRFAPVIEPTLDVGVRALVAAAGVWLSPSRSAG